MKMKAKGYSAGGAPKSRASSVEQRLSKRSRRILIAFKDREGEAGNKL